LEAGLGAHSMLDIEKLLKKSQIGTTTKKKERPGRKRERELSRSKTIELGITNDVEKVSL